MIKFQTGEKKAGNELVGCVALEFWNSIIYSIPGGKVNQHFAWKYMKLNSAGGFRGKDTLIRKGTLRQGEIWTKKTAMFLCKTWDRGKKVSENWKTALR